MTTQLLLKSMITESMLAFSALLIPSAAVSKTKMASTSACRFMMAQCVTTISIELPMDGTHRSIARFFGAIMVRVASVATRLCVIFAPTAFAILWQSNVSGRVTRSRHEKPGTLSNCHTMQERGLLAVSDYYGAFQSLK
jgi:hypothetical protein